MLLLCLSTRPVRNSRERLGHHVLTDIRMRSSALYAWRPPPVQGPWVCCLSVLPSAGPHCPGRAQGAAVAAGRPHSAVDFDRDRDKSAGCLRTPLYDEGVRRPDSTVARSGRSQGGAGGGAVTWRWRRQNGRGSGSGDTPESEPAPEETADAMRYPDLPRSTPGSRRRSGCRLWSFPWRATYGWVNADGS